MRLRLPLAGVPPAAIEPGGASEVTAPAAASDA
jgi:hypothetical protein